MKLAWGTDERKANERNTWRKMSGCIILIGYMQREKKTYINRTRIKKSIT